MSETHWPQILTIIRGGMTGDKKLVSDYTKFLASKVRADGDSVMADRLEKYANGDFGKTIQAQAGKEGTK